MSYLVLHIDLDFIVGTLCPDNGTSSPIFNGKEELLWLYFFNNPLQNIITFGKVNKSHFDNSESNYYGNFFSKIENEQETFTLRGIEHPIIDLLKESGVVDNLRRVYQEKTHEITEYIPTLLTFSLSVSDSAKQKTVDYLKKHGFEIDSYTIPLAELTSYHALNQKAFKIPNGSVAIFLEATNSTLHLMKLSFSDNYFLMDGKQKSYLGKGFDPRKQALLRYVVREVSNTTYALTEDEVIVECKRFDSMADEWLKSIDNKTRNMPYCIQAVSLSKMLKNRRDVMVRKSDLESDTGHYIQELKSYFDAFLSDNVQGDPVAVFLLGNCFQSERVKTSFEQMLGADKLFFYANKDIQDILAIYPKIDISRYASEEDRIRERAKAEVLKQAEQRSLEDRQRKEQKKAAEKADAELKAEENRKEANKLYERAMALELDGKMEDARVNVKNAIDLDGNNKEYKQFFDDLKEKIKKRNEKNELYKKYLSNADNLFKNGDFENALEEYEAAKIVFDNAEIIAKIIEIKRLIKDKEKLKDKITQIASDAKGFIQQKNFEKAKSKINEILSIDDANADANMLLSEIDQILKQQEKQYNDFVKSADKFFDAANYDEAKNAYNQALTIKPAESYCLQQLGKISEVIRLQNENKENCDIIIAQADKLLESENWAEAKQQYEMAAKLCPQETSIKGKLKQCLETIKAKADAFNDLIFEATLAEKKGKLKEALMKLEKAFEMNPNSIDLKNRIKNIKFEIEFGPVNKGKVKGDPKQIDNDDFFGTTKKSDNKTSRGSDDGFLNNKSPKKENEGDFFIAKKHQKKSIEEDDFLGLNKKTKN